MFRAASNWSADRVMRRFPEFLNVAPDKEEPILFTGEMVFSTVPTTVLCHERAINRYLRYTIAGF